MSMRLAALLVVVALLGWPTAVGAADEEDARQAFHLSERGGRALCGAQNAQHVNIAVCWAF
jgi:hypothetical protein